MNPSQSHEEGSSGSLEFDVPLAALRSSSMKILSTMLNPVKVIPTESGLPRDWRGLAELSGIPSETIAFLQAKTDPIGELLQLWYKREDSRCQLISDLTAFLAVIDRYDVIADATPLMVGDAQHYKSTLQDNESRRLVVSPLDPLVEKDVLTIEDSERVHQGLPLTRYDAFLLYADEDGQFANRILQKMEREYNLKLCLTDRDLLPGVMFPHEVIGKLIEERCNRFIVVFSRHFEKSLANNFLVSYVQASALESRKRKIIPCLFEECQLPPSVRFLSALKYYRAENMYNFWDRLSQSIKTTVRPAPEFPFNSKTSQQFMMLDTKDDAMKWKNEAEPTPKKYSPPPSYSQSMKMIRNQSTEKHFNNHSPSTTAIASAELKLPEVPNSNPNSKKKTKSWYDKIKDPIKKVKKGSKSKSKQKCELLAD